MTDVEKHILGFLEELVPHLNMCEFEKDMLRYRIKDVRNQYLYTEIKRLRAQAEGE